MEKQRASDLRKLYDRDYYFGRTSGYSEKGYAEDHPDWEAWLELIEHFQPGRRLLDLGCAYGYLVEAAADRGFQAVGLDISDFALRQLPQLAGRLIQSEMQSLPFASDSFDVIALFDVVEHLNHPGSLLVESRRLLKPNGLLLLTTPDPLFFDRHEATHVFERPPSFWIDRLHRIGCEATFRFSMTPFNFQALAAPAGSETARRIREFQHDFTGPPEKEILQTTGPVVGTLRQGWSSLKDASREIESSASAYLLNRERAPLELTIRFRVRRLSGHSGLLVRLDSLALAEIQLTSETPEQEILLTEVLLPSGGHHLRFDLTSGNARIAAKQIDIHSKAGRCRDLTLSLPFDLFQRYELASRLFTAVGAESALDVGGLLGDQDGHLATTADFLTEAEQAASTDLRQCDHPSHVPATAWEQPFEISSFDMVLSLDVLEHLPTDRRGDFLSELDRVARHWILLGGPFRFPEVERAEELLRNHLMESHRFLEEHRSLGLPNLEETIRFFERELGYTAFVLPNGFLPRWTWMQAWTQHLFALREWRAFRDFNRIYNSQFFERDQQAPAYRWMILICKQPPSDSLRSAIEGLTATQAPSPDAALWTEDERFFQAVSSWLEREKGRQRTLHDVNFLLNSREELIGLLQVEIDRINQLPVWKFAARKLRSWLIRGR